MTYPMRFFLVKYSDWDPHVWGYGLGVTDDDVRLEWERDVEHFCKLARDQQQFQIVPSLHEVKSTRPASFWCLWDTSRPDFVGPNGSNDIRGWMEGQPDGSRIGFVDKRGQGCVASHILEKLIPEEAGVPFSEASYDTDAQHPNGNRVARWFVQVVGGQGDTTVEHGGGGGGGYAGGAHRPAEPDWPYKNYGFGVTGDWRLHFAVLARKLHGVDARDPMARAYLLDRNPDCRDRLMVREWGEPRPNGGFAGQHPSGSFCHENSHGCDIDIHNPDLGERADGTFYYTQSQREVFASRNAQFAEPIVVTPPAPAPVTLVSLEVTASVKVVVNTTQIVPVKAVYSDGSVAFVEPQVSESSTKFSATAMAGGVKVLAGRSPGDGYLAVRYGGVEKIVTVNVRKR